MDDGEVSTHGPSDLRGCHVPLGGWRHRGVVIIGDIRGECLCRNNAQPTTPHLSPTGADAVDPFSALSPMVSKQQHACAAFVPRSRCHIEHPMLDRTAGADRFSYWQNTQASLLLIWISGGFNSSLYCTMSLRTKFLAPSLASTTAGSYIPKLLSQQ